MNSIQLKEQLARRGRIYGSLITSACSHVINNIDRAGIDMIFLDTEHVPNDRLPLAWICRAYQAKNLTTFIRIPAPDSYQACQMLDGGVDGILVPYIEEVEEVKRMVGAVKYRPLKGEKLRRVLDGTLALSQEEKDYLNRFNEGKYLFINIESVRGIENLEEILQIEGVDGIIVGPHDLSVSLGIGEQYYDPRFDEAVHKIIDTCVKYNKSVGVHTTEKELQKRWSSYGMNIVLHSNDIECFVKHLSQELNEIRRANGEAPVGKEYDCAI